MAPPTVATVARVAGVAGSRRYARQGADIDDITDELDDAEKKGGSADDWRARASRQARAYKALQPILTAAMRQSDQVESQLADFLAAAPSSSADWRSGRQRPDQPPTAQLASVSVPGAFYLQPAALTDDSVRKGTNVA